MDAGFFENGEKNIPFSNKTDTSLTTMMTMMTMMMMMMMSTLKRNADVFKLFLLEERFRKAP